MGLVGVQFGGLITVGTGHHGLLLLESWQFGELTQDLHQVGIVELGGTVEQLPQVLDGGRDAFDKVFLLFEVAAEAVGAEHLKCAEEHE